MVIAAWYERWLICCILVAVIVVTRALVAEVHQATRKVLVLQRARLEMRMKAEQAEMERAHMELLNAQLSRFQNK
ncbi:MAG: hypothetical protein MO847_11780 [Candidatus Protistobacter heckmanni]|nr:hypothetical protein [Candidatus Protistobacter heckmanni]